MNRIGTTDGLFHEGNPAQGQRGTKVTDLWLNNVQEELLAIIEDAGLTPDSGNVTQILAALRSLTTRRVNNVAALRGLAGSSSLGAVDTLGYYSAGDGGGNRFVWIDASGESDNGGTVIRPTAVTGAGRWIARDRYSVTAKQFGLKGDKVTNDQTRMSALLISDAKHIRFESGVYQAYMDNVISNRTFVFDNGAIIDGVVHLAVGTGPEFSAPLTIVTNIRAIGVVTATVRVGTYYCQGIHVDKIRIAETDNSYVNQTTEGGSRGVHFYYGSQDIEVEIIDSGASKSDTAAFFVDTYTLVDSDHRPRNIKVGTLRVRQAGTSGVAITNSDRIHFDRINIDGYGSYHGVQFCGSDVVVGRIDVDGASSTGSPANIYILNNNRCIIDSIISKNAKLHGFYVSGSINTIIRSIDSSESGSDGIRLLSPTIIGNITAYNNSSCGLHVMAPATDVTIDNVTAYGNGTQGVFDDNAVNTSIREITSYNHSGAAGWGVSLYNSTGFVNRLIRSTNNVQGLRYVGITNAVLGNIICSSNSAYDIAISGSNSGFAYTTANYSTINGGPLESIPGFKGRLVSVGDKGRGDESCTLTVGIDAPTQRFGTPLTAARTITLTTAGARAGDRFRIVRNAGATGAYVLSVGGLKSLSAAGQWCDVEYNGGSWTLTAYGDL
jgi:hypothetical protein